MRTFKQNRFSAKSKKSGDENFGPYTTAPDILAVYRAIVELSKFLDGEGLASLLELRYPQSQHIREF